MATPEWETSKENVAPIARGRNVDTLNKALTADVEVLNSTRSFHESAIRDASNAIGPFADDPLAPWVNYTKWVIDNFPRGSDLIISVVEGACRRFAKDPRYREDRRFVRLWIRYADLRTDKLDVFAYMEKHQIGKHAALFYEAWATTLELSRDYDRAEEVYNVGMRLNAEPQERLAQRMREYYNRMAARARRAEKKAKEAKKKKEDVQRAKDANAQRSQSTLADKLLSRPEDNQDSHGQPQRAQNDENAKPGAPVREALGRLTEQQADTGLRPMAAVSKKKPPVWTQSSRSAKQGNKGHIAQNEKIEIYVDSRRISEASSSSQGAKPREEEDDFPFAPLVKARDVSKENTGLLPSKWAGEKLPQNPRAQRKVNQALNPVREPIHIYQEGEDEGSNIAHEPGSSPEGPSAPVTSTSTQMQANEGPPPASEPIQIYHDDGNDNRHAEQDTEASAEAGSSTERLEAEERGPQSPPPKRKSAVSTHGNSPTINTKIAMREVEDLFNSSLPMEEERARALTGSRVTENQFESGEIEAQASSIEIYQDIDAEDKENAHSDRAPRSASSNPSGSRSLEKRILQPIPELEGPLVHRVVDESELMPRTENAALRNMQNIPVEIRDENAAPTLQQRFPVQESRGEQERDQGPNETDDPATSELIDFLASWCYQEPGCHLLDKEDPEVFVGDEFDLHPRGQDVATFNVVRLAWKEYTRTSEVFAVKDLCNTLVQRRQSELNDDEDNLLTLKVYETSNPWEFYIYRTMRERYQRPVESIPAALAYFEGSPAGYLFLNRMCPLTLENIITSHSSVRITEGVAMYLVADLLRAIESVHAAGIIHSDVTLSNIVFRGDRSEDLIEDRFMGSDPGSWAARGILLVEFHHAIDTKLASSEGKMAEIVKHTAEHGNSFLDAEYRIPNGAAWGFNIDCYCAAVCASKLLKLGVLQGDGDAAGLGWVSVWDTFFDSMQRLGAMSKASATIDTMRRCREIMESVLFEFKGLKSELEEFSQLARSRCAE